MPCGGGRFPGFPAVPAPPLYTIPGGVYGVPGFVTYAVFFGILAIAAQMKGLIAPVTAGLVLLPELASDGQWRRMLRPSIVPAALLGVAIYLAPFVASSLTQPAGYTQSGLQMVFHENAVRYQSRAAELDGNSKQITKALQEFQRALDKKKAEAGK